MTYAVPRRVIAALAAVALAAAVATTILDGPGRILFAILALGAGGEALRSLALNPTIAADADGITVAHGLRREHHPWPDVANVTTLAPPGSGRTTRRRASAVEIDLGDRLLHVAGYRLDAPVAEVAAALGSLR